VLFVAVSCAPSAPAGSPGAPGGQQKVAMLNPLANQFQSDIVKGARELAQKNNIEFSDLNFNTNSQTEAQFVADLITKKVNVIIYGVNDPKIALNNMQRIKDAGIKVVCFDSCLEENVQQQFVEGFATSDNADMGKQTGMLAADYIRTKLGGKAKIAFVTCDVVLVCRMRSEQQKKALEGLDIKIVADQIANTPDAVKTTSEGILQANPDLDMFITDGLSMTVGTVAAVRNLRTKTVVFGMDITSAIAQDLLASDGILQASVGQDGIKQGTVAMQMAIDALGGKKPSPFQVLIPGIVYKRDNPQLAQDFINSHPQ
jgi:simple sugar transport system substrate-binding protein